MKAALDAAITRVPRLLIADWITRLAILNTALWIPAGSPIRRIFRRQALSMDSLCKSRCTHFSVFVSLIKRMEELTILATLWLWQLRSPHSKDDYKKEIQKHIQYTAAEQGQKRCPGIAGTAENSSLKIKEKDHRQPRR